MEAVAVGSMAVAAAGASTRVEAVADSAEAAEVFAGVASAADRADTEGEWEGIVARAALTLVRLAGVLTVVLMGAAHTARTEDRAAVITAGALETQRAAMALIGRAGEASARCRTRDLALPELEAVPV